MGWKVAALEVPFPRRPATHKELEMTSTDQPVSSVVSRTADHQQGGSGLHQGAEWVGLQGKRSRGQGAGINTGQATTGTHYSGEACT